MTNDPDIQPPRKRRSKWWMVLPLMAVVVLVVVVASSSQKFKWLTPAELAETKTPGLVGSMKQRLKTWFPSVYGWYRGRQPNISIVSDTFTLPSGAPGPAGLGEPVATNAAGMRAWILPAKEFSAWLPFTRPATSATGGSIFVRNGQEAQVSYGQGVPIAPGIFTNVGLMVRVLPRAVSGSVKMVVSASSTEMAASSSTNGHRPIKTNFFLASRVLVPSGDVLVILRPDYREEGGTNFWLILSPTIIEPPAAPRKR